jgi:hypothetical protein
VTWNAVATVVLENKSKMLYKQSETILVELLQKVMSFLRTPRGTFFESLVTCQSIPGLFGEEIINVSANIGPGQSS